MKQHTTFWCAFLMLAGSSWLPASAVDLTVNGTEFELRIDGDILRSKDLVGAEIEVGSTLKLRIDGVRSDPSDPEIMLHRFRFQREDGTWYNPCLADIAGMQEAFPLSGRWNSKGFYSDKNFFAVTCTSGAEAKCVRLGYKPWKSSWDGRNLRPVFESCVRMLRADYCGDGVAMTRNGTPIAVYDDYRVRRTWLEPGFKFEAGWSPAGAVCVRRTRVPDQVSLDDLGRRCPRLKAMLGDACDEQAARRGGAILFNISNDERSMDGQSVMTNKR